LSGAKWSAFEHAFDKTGDLGSTVKILFKTSKVRKQTTLLQKPLTVMEVRKSLESLAEVSGKGAREKKERVLETLLSRATPLEAKYLVKILIGEMRTGFYEGLMELAVAQAFNVPYQVVQRATMMTGDVGKVAAIAKTEGLAGISNLTFKVFHPIKPMLAQTANNLKEVLQEHGTTALEYKLDGARIQIHKLGNQVKIFSRRLTDVTTSLPEVVETVKKELKVHEAIVEGEVIAVDEHNCPLPFQHLLRRFRRVHEVKRMLKEVPIKLYLFDVIWIDGESLIDLPYTERREKLHRVAGKILLTPELITANIEKAKSFLKKALQDGHEGVVAKKPTSTYVPGARGKAWFKVKQVLEPLDLVIVAAEYGYGRRHAWLSDYYLAAKDVKTGEFMVVGKTFKGLTDKEIIQMTERLKELTIRKEGRRVIVLPRVVVEVAYNEIQRSPKYRCGMALRFARITRIREDKSPEEVDTIQKVREIYEKQFKKV
jgi:DNA ligase-1